LGAGDRSTLAASVVIALAHRSTAAASGHRAQLKHYPPRRPTAKPVALRASRRVRVGHVDISTRFGETGERRPQRTATRYGSWKRPQRDLIGRSPEFNQFSPAALVRTVAAAMGMETVTAWDRGSGSGRGSGSAPDLRLPPDSSGKPQPPAPRQLDDPAPEAPGAIRYTALRRIEVLEVRRTTGARSRVRGGDGRPQVDEAGWRPRGDRPLRRFNC
jgi:hypothetical protein